MKRMATSNVLVVGLQGLGVEIGACIDDVSLYASSRANANGYLKRRIWPLLESNL